MSDYILVAGTANPQFAQRVAIALDKELAEVEVKRFSDGEINVNIAQSVELVSHDYFERYTPKRVHCA